MAKYLIEASYTVEGLKGLLKDGGTGRKKAIEATLKSVGGKLEALYFAFGKSDVFLLIDMPDNVSTAAVGLTVAASGSVRSRTVVLLTPAEIDQAVKKAVSYRPPGK